jgi:hypothetical protein
MEAVEDLYRAHAPGLARFALVLLGDKIAADLPETAGRELDEIPA